MAITSFEEFWPFYLGEHRDPVCRGLHYAGSSMGLAWAGISLATANPMFLVPALLNGYAFAWIGHFVFEKNKPASFKYPLWSFAADWKLWWLFVSGRIGKELEKQEKAGFRLVPAT